MLTPHSAGRFEDGKASQGRGAQSWRKEGGALKEAYKVGRGQSMPGLVGPRQAFIFITGTKGTA